MKLNKRISLVWVIWILAIAFNVAVAKKNTKIEQMVKLQDVIVESGSNDSVQVTLQFSDLPRIPTNFVMSTPPELVFDFTDTINDLSREKLFQKLSFNLVKSINFVNNDNKVRMVVALNNVVRFVSEVNGNNLILTIKNEAYKGSLAQKDTYDISALDFRRGGDGEGKLVLDVKSEMVNIDVKDDGNSMQIEFKDATIPSQLLRRFDVNDFGTPMKNVTITKEKNNIVVKIVSNSECEKISYHMGDKYIIEARPMSELQQQIEKTRKFKFTGEKISLNFQEIEIRAVLQLLADFTGLNIVANESVQGNVTLRLENIPWDQALDFILKSKGLGKRESGNVLLIAPSSELSKYEEIELASVKQLEALAPLKSEFVPVNYAKAEDMVKMIKGDKNSSLLSDRGSITVDSRTNTLLIKEIEDKIGDIKGLIKMLDVPMKQVLIEAYVVACNESFQDMLGIKLNGAARAALGSRRIGFGAGSSSAGSSGSGGTTTTTTNPTTGTTTTSTTTAASSATTAAGAAQSLLGSTPNLNTGQFFDLSTGGVGILGLALSRLPGGTILNMEIDAGEKEGITTSIARPKILTQDKQAASIESGTNVPYTTPGSTGYAGTTSFQKATLSLSVTPQITPNDQISMDLSISNDSFDTSGQSGGTSATPAMKTNSLKTNVLVDNGETIVLGGIFADQLIDSKTKIPYLSSIPLLGRLFQNKDLSSAKSEMLVFITPKIVPILEKEKDR
ncbi:MAG: type IV pilus secretin PilQ [Gammaproteobacteria bacterium]|jgi:type IV pilus assembly protein PilQ